MLNNESKTLRTYKTSTVAKNGDKLDIAIAYDMTNRGVSGYAMIVSVNGEAPTMSKKALSRVRSLGCDELNLLIDAIGTDVTGAPYDYVEAGMELINKYIAGKASMGKVMTHYRIETAKQEEELTAFITKYSKIKDSESASVITREIKKYHRTNYIRFIDRSRDTLSAFHSILVHGYNVNGVNYQITDENIETNQHYRRRDIDYIRKARVKLFDKVLKRKYKAYGEV